jgi:hypothetical protein
LVSIGPGTSAEFPAAMKLRDFMLENDYQMIFPCVEKKGTCPMVGHPSQWCHQVMRGLFPPTFQKIFQSGGPRRDFIPMMAHVYRHSKLDSHVDHSDYKRESSQKKIFRSRLIYYRGETKYAYPMDICFNDKGKFFNITIIFLKAHLDQKQKKIMKILKNGDDLLFSFLSQEEEDACIKSLHSDDVIKGKEWKVLFSELVADHHG